MKTIEAILTGAITTGLASSAGAATVQITLKDNMISTLGGDQLVADLTGDSIDDLIFGAATITPDKVGRIINGGSAYAGFGGSFTMDSFYARPRFGVGGVGELFAYAPTPVSINYLNPITFRDARINGNANTQGWLQVNAFNTSLSDHTVALTRLIFDDASTTRPAFGSIPGVQTPWNAVPEPSGLGLLALGAGGLLLRRQRKAA